MHRSEGPHRVYKPLHRQSLQDQAVELFVDGWDHDETNAVLLSASTMITKALCLSYSQGLRQYHNAESTLEIRTYHGNSPISVAVQREGRTVLIALIERFSAEGD